MTNVSNELRNHMSQLSPANRDEGPTLTYNTTWEGVGLKEDGSRLYIDSGAESKSIRFIERSPHGKFYEVKNLDIDWKRAPVTLNEEFPTETWGRHSATSTLDAATIIALHRAVGRLKTNRDKWQADVVTRELHRLDKEWGCNLFGVTVKDEPMPACINKKREELSPKAKAVGTLQQVKRGSAWA